MHIKKHIALSTPPLPPRKPLHRKRSLYVIPDNTHLTPEVKRKAPTLRNVLSELGSPHRNSIGKQTAASKTSLYMLKEQLFKQWHVRCIEFYSGFADFKLSPNNLNREAIHMVYDKYSEAFIIFEYKPQVLKSLELTTTSSRPHSHIYDDIDDPLRLYSVSQEKTSNVNTVPKTAWILPLSALSGIGIQNTSAEAVITAFSRLMDHHDHWKECCRLIIPIAISADPSHPDIISEADIYINNHEHLNDSHTIVEIIKKALRPFNIKNMEFNDSDEKKLHTLYIFSTNTTVNIYYRSSITCPEKIQIFTFDETSDDSFHDICHYLLSTLESFRAEGIASDPWQKLKHNIDTEIDQQQQNGRIRCFKSTMHATEMLQNNTQQIAIFPTSKTTLSIAKFQDGALHTLHTSDYPNDTESITRLIFGLRLLRLEQPLTVGLNVENIDTLCVRCHVSKSAAYSDLKNYKYHAHMPLVTLYMSETTKNTISLTRWLDDTHTTRKSVQITKEITDQALTQKLKAQLKIIHKELN